MGQLEALEASFKANPRSKVFMTLAESYQAEGRLEESEKVLTQGLIHHPTNLPGRMMLARLLIGRQAFDEAREMLRRVLMALPDHVEANVLLGELEEANGNVEEARKHYRIAILFQPDYPGMADKLNNLETNRPETQEVPAGGMPVSVPPPKPVDETPSVPDATLEITQPGSGGSEKVVDKPQPSVDPIPEEAQEDSAFNEGAPSDLDDDPLILGEDTLDSLLEMDDIPLTQTSEPIPEAPPTIRTAVVPSDGGSETESQPTSSPIFAQSEESMDALLTMVDDQTVNESTDAAPLDISAMAEEYVERGHLDKAIEMYQKLLVRKPDDPVLRARVEEIDAKMRGTQTAPPIEEDPTPNSIPSISSNAALRHRRVAALESWMNQFRRGKNV